MRSNYFFKSKIKKFFFIFFVFYILFYIIDYSKVNYKYVNKNLVTFDNKNLSFKSNIIIYNLYNKIYYYLNYKDIETYWVKEKDERFDLEENFTIKGTDLTSIKLNDYSNPKKNWERSHGNNLSNRFSDLKIINKNNIKNLEVAWIYNSNNKNGQNIDIQCNPIIIDGIIYTPVIGGFIAAIDGSNGKELWRSQQFNADVARRGLVYWKNKNSSKERIFFNNGSKLISLIPKTGELDKKFGKNGSKRTGYSKITPLVYKDKIIVATWKKTLEVYDLITGELRWKYYFGDGKRKRYADIKYNNLKGGNPWGGISLDEQRGIVYITTGNPIKYFDGTERPGENYNSNSIIAIDLENKKLLWSFQETFHDIWNLDLPAPPILTSIIQKNEFYDVVVVPTKRGNTLILDRVTGKSPFDLRYKVAPFSNIPGEKTSKYQLDFQKPEPFSISVFSKQDITNLNPEATDYVKKIVENSQFGFFQPISIKDNTIFFNFHGGAEWMGASIDHNNQTMFVNSNEIAWLGKLIKTNEGNLISNFKRLKDEKGYPGNKPPWGKITSLNLNSGDINWSIPFGNYKNLLTDNQKTGTENFGGLTATAGGLIFATGTLDRMFYVFDSKNGSELFSYELPFIGSAPPSTYLYNNEQYVIIQSTGSYSLQQGYPEYNEFGDAIVAFKLKK